MVAASPRFDLRGLLFGLFRLVPGGQAPIRPSNLALEMSKLQSHAKRAALPQKPIEIFVFPASCPVVTVELAFTPVKLPRVNLSATVFVNFLRYDGVKHFVVNDILQKPGRNERCVQQRMNTNHFVFFVNRSEDKVFFWGELPFSAPGDPITSQRITEVSGIQFVE
jgi:hypothetical protein